MPVARLFRRAAGAVAFHQKQFGQAGVLADAVGEFAGQRRAAGGAFARNLFVVIEAFLRVANGKGGERFADVGVFVEIQPELVFADAGDPGGASRRKVSAVWMKLRPVP